MEIKDDFILYEPSKFYLTSPVDLTCKISIFSLAFFDDFTKAFNVYSYFTLRISRFGIYLSVNSHPFRIYSPFLNGHSSLKLALLSKFSKNICVQKLSLCFRVSHTFAVNFTTPNWFLGLNG